MPQMIFVNLPVTSLAASRAILEALGATHDPRFSDDPAAAEQGASAFETQAA